MNLSEKLKPELEILIQEAKNGLGEVKRVAVSRAWKILQLVIARIIQTIEQNGSGIEGKDKKAVAMQLIEKFYNSVFVVIDIPFIPPLVEPIIHRYVKTFLMILVGSTIDAMVITFKDTGIFDNKGII
jgi:nucleoside diphosphate kinase